VPRVHDAINIAVGFLVHQASDGVSKRRVARQFTDMAEAKMRSSDESAWQILSLRDCATNGARDMAPKIPADRQAFPFGPEFKAQANPTISGPTDHRTRCRI
jgi:hypothetical protein